MRTGRDILAAGVFTPSRSSSFQVEQRRAQVGCGVAIYAKPLDQESNQAFRGNDIRLDAHDMVLMLWRDGAFAPSFWKRSGCASHRHVIC